jgi:hypothetical protein
MRFIYKNAEEVLVSLGEALDKSSPLYAKNRDLLASREVYAFPEERNSGPPFSTEDFTRDHLLSQQCAPISEFNHPVAIMQLLTEVANISAGHLAGLQLFAPRQSESTEVRVRAISEWLREFVRCSWWRRI